RVRSPWAARRVDPPSRCRGEVPATLIEWERVGPSASGSALSQVASRPGARAAGGRPVPSLSPGDKVTHDAFGLGTVVSVYDKGEKASVDSGGDYGVRTLVLRYASIEKL